jgi:hypothetical protein
MTDIEIYQQLAGLQGIVTGVMTAMRMDRGKSLLFSTCVLFRRFFSRVRPASRLTMQLAGWRQ